MTTKPDVTPKPKPAAKKAAGVSASAVKAKAKKPVAKPKAKALTVKVGDADVVIEPRQQRFVDEYVVDLNGTQAAIRAGYSAKTAAVIATENLTKPNIQAAIAIARQKQQERTGITADRVLREAWHQVTADARELTQLRIGCCRYCFGSGHRRQRTQVERDFDLEDFESKGGELIDFDEEGGLGFDPHLAPNAACPECAGGGRARAVLMDTRNLSAAAVSLYAGVKQTKFGVEVMTHSKDAAMEKLFKHLGLYELDNAQKSDPFQAMLDRITSTNANGFAPVADDPEHQDG